MLGRVVSRGNSEPERKGKSLDLQNLLTETRFIRRNRTAIDLFDQMAAITLCVGAFKRLAKRAFICTKTRTKQMVHRCGISSAACQSASCCFTMGTKIEKPTEKTF